MLGEVFPHIWGDSERRERQRAEALWGVPILYRNDGPGFPRAPPSVWIVAFLDIIYLRVIPDPNPESR